MSVLSLRIPDALKTRAAAIAKAQGLSLNSLVVVALSDYLVRQQAAPGNGARATVPGVARQPQGKPGSNHQKGLRAASDEVRFTCPLRVRSPGVLGLDLFSEFRR